MNRINGGCLCGRVKFTVLDKFNKLFFCHCTQCKNITGSAYASNLFVDKEAVKWLQGLDHVTLYKDPTRDFSKAFCSHCGCGIPYISSNNKQYVVPAGSLKEEPETPVATQIFCGETAKWEDTILTCSRFSRFPE